MSIKVLMLSLEKTLVDKGALLPQATGALETLAGMQTADGEALATCLVSDFKMPSRPPSAAKVAAIFEEYLKLLERLGLREFFEPVEQRVTLSAQAGATMTDRAFFEKAIERLGINAALSECLLITGNAAQIKACATSLQMPAIQFGSPNGFTDWAEGPLLVAAKLDGARDVNFGRALALWLRARRGAELVRVKMSPGEHRALADVKTVWPIPAGDSLHVQMPVTMEIRFDDAGRVKSLDQIPPGEEAISEAAHFVETLQAHGQIAPEHGGLTPNATHQIETDNQGRKVITRRRFSAI